MDTRFGDWITLALTNIFLSQVVILNTLIRNLSPSEYYVFEVVGGKRTHPMRVMNFMASADSNKAIISISKVIWPNSANCPGIEPHGGSHSTALVWSQVAGWNPDDYAQYVRSWVSLVDSRSTVPAYFIAKSAKQNLSVSEAVSRFFERKNIDVKMVHSGGGTLLVSLAKDKLVMEAKISIPMRDGKSFTLEYFPEQEQEKINRVELIWDRDFLSSVVVHFNGTDSFTGIILTNPDFFSSIFSLIIKGLS